MAFDVIDNPDFRKFRKQSGFKNSEFKQLAALYSRAAAVKALYDMAVDVDFDEGICAFTYYRSNAYKPALRFVIRRVGPYTDMYELYKEEKGRIAKSGLFRRVFARLEEEVNDLIDKN